MPQPISGFAIRMSRYLRADAGFSRHATGGGGQRLRKVDAVYEPERPAAPAAGGGAGGRRRWNYSKRGLLALRQQVATVFPGVRTSKYSIPISTAISLLVCVTSGVAEEEIARRVDEALTLVDARGFASSRSSASAMGRKNGGWQSPGRWCCRRATCCLTSHRRASIRGRAPDDRHHPPHCRAGAARGDLQPRYRSDL